MRTINVFILLSIMLLNLTGCSNAQTSQLQKVQSEPLAYPILVLYGAWGEFLCNKTMTTGRNLLLRVCPNVGNNQVFYFKIENPREGISFEFNETMFPFVPPYKYSYKIINPLHGQSTRLMSINAGALLPENVEIVRGIWTNQPKPSGTRAPLMRFDKAAELSIVNNN